jgi:hypothetical protein
MEAEWVCKSDAGRVNDGDVGGVEQDDQDLKYTECLNP